MAFNSLLIKFIRKQVKKGFAPIILFVGRQRMGKTFLALLVSYIIDKNFDPNIFLTNDVEKLCEIYDKYEKKIIVFDEAGTTLDPVEHANAHQRVFNHIVESQAYKNHTLLLCVPYSSEIAKKHQKHVNAVVWVNRRGGYKLYSTFSWFPDFSQKPPRLELMEDVYGVPMPPKHIMDYYTNQGQKAYKESILANEIARLKKAKEKAQGTGEKRYFKPPLETINFTSQPKAQQ